MATYQMLNLPSAWTAAELREHPDWIYHLSETEMDEINQGLVNAKKTAYLKLTPSQFPIPHLSKQIKEKFLQQLENGIGALLIRGLPVSDYNILQLERILYGIGLHFGVTVSQSIEGEKLHYVYDQGYSPYDSRSRGTNTCAEIVMHNDFCDVPVLMCVRQAKQGGTSKLVSSVAIHNEMLKHYPELLQQLYQPYYFLRQKINATLKHEYYARPIFSNNHGYFACHMLRSFIDLAQYRKDVPKMTPIQIKALDVFEELASSDELCHYFQLEPGDLLFVNSYTTLHAREAFIDEEDPDKRRLLLRLWLSVPNSRPLPESYRIIYRHIEAGAVRGGILPAEEC